MRIIHLILLIIMISFSQTADAQTNRTGSFVANSAIYPISGDISVTDIAGVKTVTFEANFATIQGITLEVFLAKTNVLNFSTDILISTAPLDSGTAMNTPITGMRTFTVPNGVSIYDFDNIIVQCTSASVLWGHANICASQLLISTTGVSSGTYRAADQIISDSELAASSSISYECADYIELNNGFEVPLSTDFMALAGVTYGCSIE